MKQSKLVGPQGSFQVPPGESRIGSDAACQICVQGDGILPVHAYLRMDGEKLLIRPADLGTTSSTYPAAAIFLNGKRVAGPESIRHGQEFSIGGVKMRLVRNGVAWPRIWSWRWFRVATWMLGGLLAVAASGYLWLKYVTFSDTAIEAKLKPVFAYLHREDAEIGTTHVSLWDGCVNLTNIKIPDRENFSSSGTPFIFIPSASIAVDFWTLLRSRFREYRVVVNIDHPVIEIERSDADGALNIEDILQRTSQPQPPVDLGMDKLSFVFKLSDGEIKLRNDNAQHVSLHHVNIALRQSGAGQPLLIERCEMIEGPTEFVKEGYLKVSGKLHVMNDACIVDFSKLSSEAIGLKLENFDLGRFIEPFGYAWAPHDANFKVVPGAPLDGEIGLTINSPRDLLLHGYLQSWSLLAIKGESKAPQMDNFPVALQCQGLHLVDNGRGYIPHQMDIKLRGGSNYLNSPSLQIDANGKLNPGGSSAYSVVTDCTLQELLDTPIGRCLGLAGSLGGRLQGSAILVKDGDGSMKIDANLESKDSYVMMAGPGSAGVQPATSGQDASDPRVRQPLPVKFECHASAQPGEKDGSSYLDLERFSLSAPSFEARSAQPGMITYADGNLAAGAQFKLNLKGREFWTEFAPILALFGFKKPIEEVLDLRVTVYGKDDLLSIGARGTAVRQWDADPAPVNLDALLDYNARAARHRGPDAAPFLIFGLKTSSSEGKPLDVTFHASWTRTEDIEIIDVSKDKILPGLSIDSDIETLRARFRPYFERYLQIQDEAAGNTEHGWLQFYRDSTLTGQWHQTGKVMLTRKLNKGAAVEDRLKFELAGEGDFKADLATRFQWQEPGLRFGLKGSYEQVLSETKEKPDKQQLNLERMDFSGRLGSLHLAVNDLDLFALSKVPGLPNKAWTDFVGNLSVSGRIDAPAYDFLRALGALPKGQPASGSLDVKVAFDREKDELNLNRLALKQSGSLPLSELDASGVLLHVRGLIARLWPVQSTGDNLAERLSDLLEESGPAGLLDHLGSELTLNALQLETEPFMEWLKQTYGGAGAAHKLPMLFAGVLNGNWRPEGSWRAAGVKLSRLGEAANRKWILLGALLRNDFTVYDKQPAPDGGRRTLFSFSHDWQIKMGLALMSAGGANTEDNLVAAEGDLILDNAYVYADFPAMKYEYKKLAKESCTIQLSDCRYSHKLPFLANLGKVHLIGQPLDAELKDFAAEYAPGVAPKFGPGQFAITGGPLPCTGTIRKYEPESGKLDLDIHAANADLKYLAQLFNLSEQVQAGGSLKDVAVIFKGSTLGLGGKRLPELDPARDSLELDAELHDATLQRVDSDSADPSETDCLALHDATLQRVDSTTEAAGTLALGGHLHLTSRDLALLNLTASVNGAAGLCSFQSSKLQLNSADAALNLFQAFKAPGMPVHIGGAVTFTTPLNSGQLAAMKGIFVGGTPAVPGAGGGNRFASIKDLHASGSLKLPAFVAGAVGLTEIETENVSFDALKAVVPLMTASFAGGKLAISRAEFDFSKAKEAEAEIPRGVAFQQTIRLTDADLGTLIGKSDDKNYYTVNGHINADGTLAGSDFAAPESWVGKMEVTLKDFTAENKGLKEARGSSGYEFRSAVFHATPWSQKVARLPSAGSMNAFIQAALLDIGLYLFVTFNFEPDVLEFQPVKLTVNAADKMATLEPFRLVGRGECEGLTLQVTNVKIRLSDGALSEDALFYPLAIPPSAIKRMAYWERRPASIRQEYFQSLKEGRFSLHLSGSLAQPVLGYPWKELQSFGRRALFGAEQIDDLETLARAREYFHKVWGKDADIDSASNLADWANAGLPGTVNARQLGESIISRVPGLPQSLQQLNSSTGTPISPRDSLRKLLNPEADKPGSSPGSK